MSTLKYIYMELHVRVNKTKTKKTFKYTRFAGTVVKTSKYKIVQVTSSTSC